MSDLDQLASRFLEHFEAKDAAREESLRMARSAIRSSSRAIRSIHRGEISQAEEHISQGLAALERINALLEEHRDVRYAGYVDDAEQEIAEARILLCIITERRLPPPEEVGVDLVNYLAGLGDVTGELRRHILDLIGTGEPEKAEYFLETMEEIFHLLMLFDYPDAVTRGLRRKGDLARSMMERTRGDLANALGRSKLEKRLKQAEDKLKDPD
ncbi:MAG: translin family protein [Methanosarcinales archaeon]|nr:translin family protein [Methanosarcinales archaeon]